MAARGDRPPSDQSRAESAIILDAFERDPGHVFRVLAQIAERLKADGRYTAEEVEAAAMYLCRELGISRSLQSWLPPKTRSRAVPFGNRPADAPPSFGDARQRSAADRDDAFDLADEAGDLRSA